MKTLPLSLIALALGAAEIAHARLPLGAPSMAASQPSASPLGAEDDSLMALLADGSALPNDTQLTIQLLEAGPGGTSAFMTAFEQKVVGTSPKGVELKRLADLSRRLRRTPEVIARTIKLPAVSGSMRNDAIHVALEIMRRDGNKGSSDRLVRMCEFIHEANTPSFRGLSGAIERYASAAVDNVEVRLSQVNELLSAAPPALQASVIDGISRARRAPRAAGFMIELIPKQAPHVGTLLNRAAAIARRDAVILSGTQCHVIRELMDSERAFIRREAAFALGAVGDHEAIPALIEHLSDEDASVGQASHDSLRKLTSMTISGDPHRWKLWYERQQTWWKARGVDAIARIPVAPLGELTDLISEVSTKRLYRSEIADALVTLLERKDPRYVELGLSALTNLRAPSTVDQVALLRSHPKPIIRQRANDALRALKAAGIDVPVLPIDDERRGAFR